MKKASQPCELSREVGLRVIFPQALCAVFSYCVGEWHYTVSCTKPMLVCKAVTAPCSCHLVKDGDSWCNGLLHHSARLETEHGAQTAATSAHAHGKPLHVWLTLHARPFSSLVFAGH